MIHNTPHENRNSAVRVTGGPFEGKYIVVEDWWDRVNGGTSWMLSDGNPACIDYAIRFSQEGLPMDDEVIYGKIGYFGKLVHVSQLEA